jgi:peptidoglycan/LPS O-acetylase OafA/YrhL
VSSVGQRHAGGNRYIFLDGIRGLAAVFVLTRHTTFFWDGNPFFRSYLAVDIFFIMSGFVIASAYEEKLRTNLITVNDFILIRVIRLYPIYFISFLLCCYHFIRKVRLGYEYGSSEEVVWVLLSTAFFLPSKMPSSEALFPLNGAYWSLFFELLANFSYALIRPVLNDFLLTVVSALFGLLVAVAALQNGGLDNGFKWDTWMIVGGLSRAFFGIFLGLLIFRKRKSLDYFFRRHDVPWLAVFVVMLVLMSPSVGVFDPLVDVVVVLVVFPACLIVASKGASEADNILMFLGSASYPIYVLHFPLAQGIYLRFQNAVTSTAPYSGLAFVVFIMIFSVWLERVYDIPIRRKLTALLVRRRNSRKFPAQAS